MLKGTKLADVLRQFQEQGMKINFSSGLVTPDMTVLEEPQSTSERAILDEVLNPHGLKILDGPAKIFLVVRNKNEIGSSRTSQLSEEVDVPFVTLYVAARGSNDRLITTLKPEDFVLKEDEAEQKIVEFTNLSSSFKQEPVSVLLLVDHSMSMKDRHAGGRKFDFVRKAVSKFLDSLQPEDRVMLAGFHQAFWTLSDLTQDKDLIRERLNQEPDLRDRTALLDILPLAIKQMENFPDRKILVLCSDGMDSASRMNIESVVHILQSSDVTVYTIANEFPSGNWGRMILEKISSSTGGYSFFGSSDSDLNKSILQIRTAIGGQYAVGYVPRYPFLHKWREVRVECKVPGIRLHYRNRYLF